MAEAGSEIKAFLKSIRFRHVFGTLCLLLLAALVYILSSRGMDIINLTKFGAWLREAGTADVARGLITFMVVLATVIIAILLVVFALFGKSECINENGVKVTDEAARKGRFNNGLQVLTLFMGILGTIMGFYYAEGTVPVREVKNLTETKAEGVLAVTELENSGWQALTVQNFAGALKAFSEARKLKEHSAIVGRVADLLEPEEENFAAADTEAKKTEFWKSILCVIMEDKDISGIPADLKDGLDKTAAQVGCNPPEPEEPEE